MDKVVEYLSKHLVFKYLSQQDTLEMLQLAIFPVHKLGEVMLMQDTSPVEHVYLILSGKVKITKHKIFDDSKRKSCYTREIDLAVIGRGDLFGLQEILEKEEFFEHPIHQKPFIEKFTLQYPRMRHNIICADAVNKFLGIPVIWFHDNVLRNRKARKIINKVFQKRKKWEQIRTDLVKQYPDSSPRITGNMMKLSGYETKLDSVLTPRAITKRKKKKVELRKYLRDSNKALLEGMSKKKNGRHDMESACCYKQAYDLSSLAMDLARKLEDKNNYDVAEAYSKRALSGYGRSRINLKVSPKPPKTKIPKLPLDTLRGQCALHVTSKHAPEMDKSTPKDTIQMPGLAYPQSPESQLPYVAQNVAHQHIKVKKKSEASPALPLIKKPVPPPSIRQFRKSPRRHNKRETFQNSFIQNENMLPNIAGLHDNRMPRRPAVSPIQTRRANVHFRNHYYNKNISEWEKI